MSGGVAPAVYVILAGKPGSFRTELGPDVRSVEAYDYVFFGRTKAHFVIAELHRETKIAVIDEALPPTVSRIPSKLLKKYASVAEARRDLEHLARPGSADVALVRVAQ